MPVKIGNIITNSNGRDGTHVSDHADVEIGDVQASGNKRDGFHIGGSGSKKTWHYWIISGIVAVIAAVLAGMILFYAQDFLPGERPPPPGVPAELPSKND